MTTRGHHALLLGGGAVPPVDLSHFDVTLYTGDNSFPFSAASPIDLTDAWIWVKRRAPSALSHARFLKDGASWYRAIESNSGMTDVSSVFSTDSDSFDLSADTGSCNVSGSTYVAWLFRKLARFCSVDFYTGNGSAGRTVTHSLGVTPGLVIVKKVVTGSWYVFHQHAHATDPEDYYLLFESTAGTTDLNTIWNDTAPDASNITLGNNIGVNQNTARYVAISFAHDASPTGVVQCPSYVGNGSASGPVVTLGWQPRFLMIKRRSGSNGWVLLDTTRTPGFSGNDGYLEANSTSVEGSALDLVSLTADGFTIASSDNRVNVNGETYLVLAIR